MDDFIICSNSKASTCFNTHLSSLSISYHFVIFHCLFSGLIKIASSRLVVQVYIFEINLLILEVPCGNYGMMY